MTPKKKKGINWATVLGINWATVLARAREMDDQKDAMRCVEIVRELYHILIVKHGESTTDNTRGTRKAKKRR